MRSSAQIFETKHVSIWTNATPPSLNNGGEGSSSGLAAFPRLSPWILIVISSSAGGWSVTDHSGSATTFESVFTEAAQFNCALKCSISRSRRRFLLTIGGWGCHLANEFFRWHCFEDLLCYGSVWTFYQYYQRPQLLPSVQLTHSTKLLDPF